MLQKYIGFLTAIPDFSYFSKSLIFKEFRHFVIMSVRIFTFGQGRKIIGPADLPWHLKDLWVLNDVEKRFIRN